MKRPQQTARLQASIYGTNGKSIATPPPPPSLPHAIHFNRSYHYLMLDGLKEFTYMPRQIEKKKLSSKQQSTNVATTLKPKKKTSTTAYSRMIPGQK